MLLLVSYNPEFSISVRWVVFDVLADFSLAAFRWVAKGRFGLALWKRRERIENQKRLFLSTC